MRLSCIRHRLQPHHQCCIPPRIAQQLGKHPHRKKQIGKNRNRNYHFSFFCFSLAYNMNIFRLFSLRFAHNTYIRRSHRLRSLTDCTHTTNTPQSDVAKDKNERKERERKGGVSYTWDQGKGGGGGGDFYSPRTVKTQHTDAGYSPLSKNRHILIQTREQTMQPQHR